MRLPRRCHRRTVAACGGGDAAAAHRISPVWHRCVLQLELSSDDKVEEKDNNDVFDNGNIIVRWEVGWRWECIQVSVSDVSNT